MKDRMRQVLVKMFHDNDPNWAKTLPIYADACDDAFDSDEAWLARLGWEIKYYTDACRQVVRCPNLIWDNEDWFGTRYRHNLDFPLFGVEACNGKGFWLGTGLCRREGCFSIYWNDNGISSTPGVTKDEFVAFLKILYRRD